MAILALLIVDPRVNNDKLVKSEDRYADLPYLFLSTYFVAIQYLEFSTVVCIVHDLAESVVGDIAPFQNVAKEDKRRWEEEGLRKITDDLHSEGVANEIVSLWLEYEEGVSVEGDVARELDKFEMVVQADEYERAQGMRLDDFFNSTEGYFTHPEVS
jgi:5'-deoxynucleotidase YfbR-like HD superfamily hydrolase